MKNRNQSLVKMLVVFGMGDKCFSLFQTCSSLVNNKSVASKKLGWRWKQSMKVSNSKLISVFLNSALLIILLAFGNSALANLRLNLLPPDNSAVISGSVISSYVHVDRTGGLCGKKASIRLQGSCTLTERRGRGLGDNNDQNLHSSGGCSGNDARVEAAVNMSSGNSVGAFKGCRVELWTNATAGSAELDYRYYSVAQAIAWTAVPSEQILGGGTSVVTAKATTADANVNNRRDTGKGISYSTTTSTVCTVNSSSGVVTPVAVGECEIRATAASDGSWGGATYLATTSDTRKWRVKSPQTITVTAPVPFPTVAAIGDTFIVKATASSGQSVDISAGGACTGSGTNSVSIVAVSGGSCTISFNQGGNVDWAAAPLVTRTVNVSKKDQTISFAAQAPQVYEPMKVVPINPLATASSDLLVEYESITTGICTITGTQDNEVQIVSVGTCTLRAKQAGNGSYNAAVPVLQNIAITKAQQTINISPAVPSRVETGASFTVAANSISGLPVTISWSGTACTTGTATSSATITVANTQGECNVSFNQAGNGNYLAADPINATVVVTKMQQEIVVTQPPAAKRYPADGPFTVVAQSRKSDGMPSGINVAITTSGGCTGSGSNSASITLTNPEILCLITYKAPGNSYYDAAADRTNTVEAIRTNQTISVTQPAPALALMNQVFIVKAASTSGLTVAISTSGGCSGSGAGQASITMTSSTSNCLVRFNQAGNATYASAQEAVNQVRDGSAPVITENAAMPNKTNATPSYSFSTNEQGTIVYGGACQSFDETALVGSNTITFKRLQKGTYNNCTVQVKDAAGNLSNKLSLAPFEVVVGVKAYVKPLASGTEDCSSWADACSDIQQAINKIEVDEVWLAKGVYRPASALQLKVGVHVVGGFSGNETSASKANPSKNLTIISGDVDANDLIDTQGLVQNTVDIQGSNSNNLVIAQNLGTDNAESSASLTGLVLNAASGHALWVKNSQVALDKVQFIANKGSQGAAVYLEMGAKLDAKAVWFKSNVASDKGAAIASDSHLKTHIKVAASTFEANQATTAGGAIAFVAGNLEVLNSTFVNNQLSAGSANGGAIDLASLQSPSLASIKYSTFVNNSAGASSGKGGAIHIASTAAVGAVSLANSLIINNSAKTAGNISDMAKISDAGFNLVGFNGQSNALTGSANYLFTGTSFTATEADLARVVDTTPKDNGGFTPTLAIPANSLAVDKIPAVHQDCNISSSIKTDQRGKKRPDLNSGNCDIGAFEAEGMDYCASVQGQDSGLNLNQNPENGALCGNGWQFGSGSSSSWMLLMMCFLGLWRVRAYRAK